MTVTPAWRWRLASPISALLLWLSFPPAAVYPLAFVAWVPVLLYLARPDTRFGRAISLFTGGLVFHVAGFFWIRHVTVVGMLLLAAYASLYWVAFAAVASAWRQGAGEGGWPFRLAAAWMVLEHVRGTALGGIPWLLAGHALVDFTPVAQAADLAGVAGVTFLAFLVNASLTQALLRASPRPGSAQVAAAALLLLVSAYGSWRIRDVDAATFRGPEVLLVQGNVEQSVKKAGLHWREILAIYSNLTRSAIEKDGLPGIVIWPETMHPAVPVTRIGPEATDPLGFRRLAPTRAVVGVLLYEPLPPERQWNSALALDPRGGVTGRYDKTHLVPVGEFFPFRTWAIWETLIRTFTALDRVPGLEAGTAPAPLAVGEWKLGVLICYESAFAYLARAQVGHGAHVLVNLSNEAWYRDSAELDQMLAMSRFRCIETRTGMARATNSGISAILDPAGRVVSVVRDAAGRTREVAGYLRGRVPVGPRRSVYQQVGEWWVVVAALALGVDLSGRAWRRRRRSRAPGTVS